MSFLLHSPTSHLISKNWFGGPVAINIYIYIKIKLLVNNKSNLTYINFFFFFCSSCSLKVWVKKNRFIICRCYCANLKYRSNDEQTNKICVFVSKTRCSFKRRWPWTYKGRLFSWIHRGQRNPEQRHADPDTFLPKYHIWYLWNRGWLISLSL